MTDLIELHPRPIRRDVLQHLVWITKRLGEWYRRRRGDILLVFRRRLEPGREGPVLKRRPRQLQGNWRGQRLGTGPSRPGSRRLRNTRSIPPAPSIPLPKSLGNLHEMLKHIAADWSGPKFDQVRHPDQVPASKVVVAFST